ncbi:AAA family ATPase, partial [Arthrobacter sp. AOP36-C1-22]
LEVLSTEDIAEILARIPTATLINSLITHPEHSDWVQKGLSLHGNRRTCLFCANDLNHDRLETLNRHFDESTTELQDELREAIEKVEEITTLLLEQSTYFPDPGLLYPEFRKEYKSLLQALQERTDEITQDLTTVRELLDAKLKSLHEPAHLPEHLNQNSFTLPNIDRLVTLLDNHDARSVAFARVRKAACQQLEAFWIGEQKDWLGPR